MVIQNVTVTNCNPDNITIGRRGTYNTEEVTFDLSYLIESYGEGTAVLMVKRSQDSTAYPAVTTQEDATLTWTISDVDAAYKGNGEGELFWYVDGGLAKSVIYPLTVLRDIGETTEEPPEAYQTWVDHLTELGAETLENAQNAVESAEKAEDAAEAAEEAAELLKDPSAEATTLSPGSPATAEYEDGVFKFGIPRGYDGSGGGGGTGDYEDLDNKPSINGHELSGNQTAAQLGLATPSDIPTVPTKVSQLTNDSGFVNASGAAAAAPVQSVNGKTGAVRLDASDVGALPDSTVIPAEVTESTVAGWGFTKNTGTYSKPASGIPKTDLADAVQTSLGKADTALQSAPVSSVAGKTGAVTLDAGDISYDDTETYQSGTVGSKLNDLKTALSELDSDKITKPASPASGAFLVWNGTAWVAQTLATWQGGNY